MANLFPTPNLLAPGVYTTRDRREQNSRRQKKESTRLIDKISFHSAVGAPDKF